MRECSRFKRRPNSITKDFLTLQTKLNKNILHDFSLYFLSSTSCWPVSGSVVQLINSRLYAKSRHKESEAFKPRQGSNITSLLLN